MDPDPPFRIEHAYRLLQVHKWDRVYGSGLEGHDLFPKVDLRFQVCEEVVNPEVSPVPNTQRCTAATSTTAFASAVAWGSTVWTGA